MHLYFRHRCSSFSRMSESEYFRWAFTDLAFWLFAFPFTFRIQAWKSYFYSIHCDVMKLYRLWYSRSTFCWRCYRWREVVFSRWQVWILELPERCRLQNKSGKQYRAPLYRALVWIFTFIPIMKIHQDQLIFRDYLLWLVIKSCLSHPFSQPN